MSIQTVRKMLLDLTLVLFFVGLGALVGQPHLGAAFAAGMFYRSVAA